jgi:hypothetical protein
MRLTGLGKNRKKQRLRGGNGRSNRKKKKGEEGKRKSEKGLN